MGAANVTVQNLKVVKTESDEGYIYVKGAVPGPKGSWVLLKDSVKKSLPEDIPLPAALKSVKGEVKKDENISDDKNSEENIESSENNGDSNES
jgi:large subunit ribosomal protein L3